jgi:general secretion pathway protein E
VYEIIKVDDQIKQAIIAGGSPELVKKQALAQGALTIIEDGLLKVFQGRTTIDEVIRVTKS